MTGQARYERATPRWARSVRAQPATSLAPYAPVETECWDRSMASQEPDIAPNSGAPSGRTLDRHHSPMEGGISMIMLGIDAHKRTHTVVAVDDLGGQSASNDESDNQRGSPRADAMGRPVHFRTDVGSGGLPLPVPTP